MKKNELLAQCRFFKGEDFCPAKFDTPRGSLFWESERSWVAAAGEADHSLVLALVECGLSDEHMQLARKPSEFVNIPLDLRAIMFVNLCHYSGNSPMHEARFFLDVVLPEYLG